jgi:hypothetical protein
MAPTNEEIAALAARAALERYALAGCVAEITRQVQPRQLADATMAIAKKNMEETFGNVSNAVKENGGTAGLIGLGAITAFEVGRLSATENTSRHSDDHASDPETEPPYERSDPPVGSFARAGAVARFAGGLAIGSILSGGFRSTALEKELMANIPSELSIPAGDFISQHSRGAKIWAAQAFGFAKYGAAFLVIMAAISNHLSGSTSSDQNDAG